MHTDVYHFKYNFSTAVEFVQKMAAVEEHHAKQINHVVATFRKKTNDTLKKDLYVHVQYIFMHKLSCAHVCAKY